MVQKNYNQIKKNFINILLKKGKKKISENIFKKLLITLKKETKKNPQKLLITFIKKTNLKIKYIQLLKKKRWNKNKWKQKKKLYIFYFLMKDNQIKAPIKWLFLKKKINYKNIIQEIIQSTQNKGRIIKLKKDYYKEIRKLKFFY